MASELHPLQPFLPANAQLLMLGSFPPPHKRWCMEFFYPNWNNDMWRIWGLIAADDKDHFVVKGEKRFDQEKIEQFCINYGIALYDTAQEVVRLKDNASDNFLQIVTPTDIASLLASLPLCHTIVATGQKSAETLQAVIGYTSLPVGGHVEASFADRSITVWRMPSSSRAYPLPLAQKASAYRTMYQSLPLIQSSKKINAITPHGNRIKF